MIDISELRRLEAEARASEGKYPPWSSLNTHEYALYVAMRNALPELLKALEDAEARKNALAECLAGSSNAEVSDRVRSRIKSIFNPPRGGVDED